MLRKGRWKLHEYIDFPSEPFDLAMDADERINRAEDSACANTVAVMRSALRRIVDPGAADRQAKADQRTLIENSSSATRRFGSERKAPRRCPCRDGTSYHPWMPPVSLGRAALTMANVPNIRSSKAGRVLCARPIPFRGAPRTLEKGRN
jgi:hypothetical protein